MSLTAKQEAFCQFVLTEKNTSDAYRKAYGGQNMAPQTVNRRAKELMDNGKIKARLKELREPAVKKAQITAQAVLERLWSIAMADPNDLIQMRRNCCRYCHGENFDYQWTEREFKRATAKAEHEQRSDPKVMLPDIAGGFGFNPTLPPHANCPDCFGEGVAGLFVTDTRQLNGPAKALFAGIKQTKEGLEIKMNDQVKALENVARHLGMFDKDSSDNPDDKPQPVKVVVEVVDASKKPDAKA